MSADSGPGRREVAYRLFAAEYDDASLSYSESDEERAPNFVVTPTGARVNRVFVAGVLTETERINEDTLRARITDPTGAFVTYAGQYQPDELAFLDRATPPAFVALTGKARTFEPDDSDRVYTSIRPESINEVDAETRDRWVVTTAESTLERLAVLARALESDLRGEDLAAALRAAGVREPLAEGIPLAIDHYGTTTSYVEGVRRLAQDALELIAGERDEIRPLEVAPGEGGGETLGPLPEVDIDLSAAEADTAAGAQEPSDDGVTGAEPPVSETPDAEAAETAADVEALDTDAEADAANQEPAEAAATASGTEPDVASDAPEEEETEPAVEVDAETTGEPETGAAEEEETEPAVDADAATVDAATDDAATDDAATDDTTTDNASGAVATPSSPDPDADVGAPDSEATASPDPTDADELGDFEDDVDTVSVGAGAPEEELGDFADEVEGDEETTTDPEPESEPAAEPETAEAGPSTDEMYELDEEERREVEEEFGTEFSTGSEVDAPGEADVDVPGADSSADEADAQETEAAETAEATEEPAEEPAAESGADADAEADADAAADVDLEEAAVEKMGELGGGDGADREAVVAAVVDETGADPAAVEDAIQDALMSGKCYEPDEGTLKAI